MKSSKKQTKYVLLIGAWILFAVIGVMTFCTKENEDSFKQDVDSLVKASSQLVLLGMDILNSESQKQIERLSNFQAALDQKDYDSISQAGNNPDQGFTLDTATYEQIQQTFGAFHSAYSKLNNSSYMAEHEDIQNAWKKLEQPYAELQTFYKNLQEHVGDPSTLPKPIKEIDISGTLSELVGPMIKAITGFANTYAPAVLKDKQEKNMQEENKQEEKTKN